MGIIRHIIRHATVEDYWKKYLIIIIYDYIKSTHGKAGERNIAIFISSILIDASDH